MQWKTILGETKTTTKNLKSVNRKIKLIRWFDHSKKIDLLYWHIQRFISLIKLNEKKKKKHRVSKWVLLNEMRTTFCGCYNTEIWKCLFSLNSFIFYILLLNDLVLIFIKYTLNSKLMKCFMFASSQCWIHQNAIETHFSRRFQFFFQFCKFWFKSNFMCYFSGNGFETIESDKAETQTNIFKSLVV